MATFQGKRVSESWKVVLDAAVREGIRFTVNSGQRTLAEQRTLYNQNMQNGRPRPGHPLTAVPNGNAPHIRVGREDHALDINSLDGGETRFQRWLESKGAHPTNPVGGESWHLELPGAELARLTKSLKPLSRAALLKLKARRLKWRRLEKSRHAKYAKAGAPRSGASARERDKLRKSYREAREQRRTLDRQIAAGS